MEATPSLEDRINRLEKSSRRWRRVSVSLGVGLIGIAMLAASPGQTSPAQDEIRTRKLVLVDDQGRTLADMASGKGQFGGLKFYDPQTHAPVAAIGINLDGTGFLMTRTTLVVDEKGRTVADVVYGKDKASGLRFYNPDTRACVCGIGFGTDGSGVLYINTKEGKPVVIHTGAVNDKGVPLENVQQAIDKFRQSLIP